MCLVGVGPVDDPSENLTSMGKFSAPAVNEPSGASGTPPPTLHFDSVPNPAGALHISILNNR